MPERKRGPTVDQDTTDRAIIAAMYLREQGWTNGRIAAAAGVASPAQISDFIAGRVRFGKARVARLIEVADSVERGKTPTTAPRLHVEAPPAPPAPTGSHSADTGVLAAITDARGDLRRAAARLQKASDHAVPLLRPGLVQLAQRIEALCKDLEVS